MAWQRSYRVPIEELPDSRRTAEVLTSERVDYHQGQANFGGDDRHAAAEPSRPQPVHSEARAAKRCTCDWYGVLRFRHHACCVAIRYL